MEHHHQELSIARSKPTLMIMALLPPPQDPHGTPVVILSKVFATFVKETSEDQAVVEDLAILELSQQLQDDMAQFYDDDRERTIKLQNFLETLVETSKHIKQAPVASVTGRNRGQSDAGLIVAGPEIPILVADAKNELGKSSVILVRMK